jgi:signal transduction histidine kinase
LIINEDDDKLIVSVKDTGMGIENNDKSKLFRLDSYYTTAGTKYEKGTGLGLILCKELVNLNGGDLSFESESGKGSEFFLSLPKVQS